MTFSKLLKYPVLFTLILILFISCNDRERLFTPGFNSDLVIDSKNWSADYLGNGWVKKHIILDEDFDGVPVATIVKKADTNPGDTAVLYIHGFSDYFFQGSLADSLENERLKFYALDLRRYGRSKLPFQIWNEVRKMDDYFEEIDSAVNIIKREGHEKIILVAHSTGGLTASLYAAERGSEVPFISIILNSPFFDFNVGGVAESAGIPVISAIGAILPKTVVNRNVSPVNCMSLHKDYYGEWAFDTIMKPVQSPMVTASWVRAIHKGQQKLQKGIEIFCPVLVMSSSAGSKGDKFEEIHKRSDTVLDPEEIRTFTRSINGNVKSEVFEGGLHDLVLSEKPVRDKVYESMIRFIRQNKRNSPY